MMRALERSRCIVARQGLGCTETPHRAEPQPHHARAYLVMSMLTGTGDRPVLNLPRITHTRESSAERSATASDTCIEPHAHASGARIDWSMAG